ncbi:MAG: hypothetical protein R3292_05175 [Alcanivorax sp.]|nr:hypothetical protein [Alcanivorax sp.]
MAPIHFKLLFTPLFDLPPLGISLALPVGVLILTTLVLWSGRIRQPLLANGLCVALLLPAVNLTLVVIGLYALGGHLNQFWMDLAQRLPV